MSDFKPGDEVEFTSKFGDRVTGVYERASEMPGADGPVRGHDVRSDNAFGPFSSTRNVLCFVSSGLRKVP